MTTFLLGRPIFSLREPDVTLIIPPKAGTRKARLRKGKSSEPKLHFCVPAKCIDILSSIPRDSTCKAGCNPGKNEGFFVNLIDDPKDVHLSCPVEGVTPNILFNGWVVKVGALLFSRLLGPLPIAHCPLHPFSTRCSDPCLENDALKPQLLAVIFTTEMSLS